MRRPRTVKYVIGPKELSASWLILYLATFALQLPCAAIRAFVAYPPLWLAFKLVGEPTSIVHDLALGVGYGPLALSVASLILPLGGWWWEQAEGGRVPSEREQLLYEDALAQLREADPKLRAPRRWFVIDEEIENASACADTLMVSRGLLDSGYLEAVLAHELGHLNTSDSRVTAALNRITTPPYRKMRRGLNTLCSWQQERPDVAATRTMERILAKQRAQGRPVRREPRPSRHSRRVPRRAPSDDRHAGPVHLADRAQPPTDRAPRRATHARRPPTTQTEATGTPSPHQSCAKPMNRARKVQGGRPTTPTTQRRENAANSGPLRTCQGNPYGPPRRGGS